MSTRTETTTSNNNTQTVEPWGPVQQPLTRAINQIDQYTGQASAFQPFFGNQERDANQNYLRKLTYAANMNDGGRDYFTPLHTQQQVSPLLQGAQFDVQTGGDALANYAANAGQVDAAGRGQQWQDWQDNFLARENPYLDDVINDGMTDLRNQLNQQFTGVGRSYDSGAYGRAAADRLGQYALRTRYDDYNTRRNQERSAFQTAMNQADQYGYGAANQLYGTGINTILSGSQAIDNQERQRIADIERVNANRASLARQELNSRMELQTALNRTPQLQAASWPLAQLMNPGGAFRSTSGRTSASASQPNNQFWPGLVSTGLGIFGSFF